MAAALDSATTLATCSGVATSLSMVSQRGPVDRLVLAWPLRDARGDEEGPRSTAGFAPPIDW